MIFEFLQNIISTYIKLKWIIIYLYYMMSLFKLMDINNNNRYYDIMILIRKIIYLKSKLFHAIHILLLIILHHLFLQLHIYIYIYRLLFIWKYAFVFSTCISFFFSCCYIYHFHFLLAYFSLYLCNFAKWYVYFSLYLHLYFIKIYILFKLYRNYCIIFFLRDLISKLANS